MNPLTELPYISAKVLYYVSLRKPATTFIMGYGQINRRRRLKFLQRGFLSRVCPTSGVMSSAMSTAVSTVEKYKVACATTLLTTFARAPFPNHFLSNPKDSFLCLSLHRAILYLAGRAKRQTDFLWQKLDAAHAEKSVGHGRSQPGSRALPERVTSAEWRLRREKCGL